jgi:electron transfer flavoprotein beta subunit
LKIGVCVKHVPAKDAPLAMVNGGAWIRESDIGFEINEPDSFALEEALRVKEKYGGEVAAISMGPERSRQYIKEALAKGANRGIHVSDPNFYKLDPLSSARSLAASLKDENFDLILTGLQSDDRGFGQTGVLLAELLGRPRASEWRGSRASADSTWPAARHQGLSNPTCTSSSWKRGSLRSGSKVGSTLMAVSPGE